MAHTNAWDETLPTTSSVVTDIANGLRKLRLDTRERLAVDHDLEESDDADGSEGQHKKLTFKEDIASPTLDTGETCIFSKTGYKKSELCYRDARGVDNKFWFVGEVSVYMGGTAPDGWLPLNGTSIGSTTSGATYAGAQYEDLYTVVWDNVANAQAPVAGGRGASAAADWAANKKMTLPDTRGRSPIGSGSGGSRTERTIGDKGGQEHADWRHTHVSDHTHTLTSSGEHTHDGTGGPGGLYHGTGYDLDTQANHNHGGATQDSSTCCGPDSNSYMEITNPMFTVCFIIKY